MKKTSSIPPPFDRPAVEAPEATARGEEEEKKTLKSALSKFAQFSADVPKALDEQERQIEQTYREAL